MRYLNGQDFHNYLRTPDSMQFTSKGNPIIQPTYDVPEDIELLGWNYVNSKKNEAWKWIHFYMEDYLFNSVWNTPDKMMEKLYGFTGVIGPDFSTFRDTPYPVQMWNHYRRQWCSAYWQANGITVIPNIRWSDEGSYEWCFDGIPKNAVVAVSMVGCTKEKEAERLFRSGYEKMVEVLNPCKILLVASDKQRAMVDGPIQHVRYTYLKEV